MVIHCVDEKKAVCELGGWKGQFVDVWVSLWVCAFVGTGIGRMGK